MRKLTLKGWAEQAGVCVEVVSAFYQGQGKLAPHETAALAEVLGIRERDMPE